MANCPLFSKSDFSLKKGQPQSSQSHNVAVVVVTKATLYMDASSIAAKLTRSRSLTGLKVGTAAQHRVTA